MALVVGMIVVGLAIAIAAVFVVREAIRLGREPPPALFDVEDAFDWLVEQLPDDVAATLTPEDVRRMLDFLVELFQRTGVSTNGEAAGHSPQPVLTADETVDFVLARAAATGEPYIPEQVEIVVETLMSFLRAIGAVGPPADPGASGPSPTPESTDP